MIKCKDCMYWNISEEGYKKWHHINFSWENRGVCSLGYENNIARHNPNKLFEFKEGDFEVESIDGGIAGVLITSSKFACNQGILKRHNKGD